MVWNLSEEAYDYSKFDNQVSGQRIYSVACLGLPHQSIDRFVIYHI